MFGVFDFHFCSWERENEVERDLMVIDDAEQKKRGAISVCGIALFRLVL